MARYMNRRTYSLPVQNVLASLASHVTTPLSSSGRPSLFNGFESAAISSRRGSVSKYAAVMLRGGLNVPQGFDCTEWTYVV